MTKYKWSLLGLILSIILFLIFLISPLVTLANAPRYPTEEVPAEFLSTSDNPFLKYDIKNKEAYDEWYKNVPKKVDVGSALNGFGKSFYHWNLFWIPIIIFSFMTFNYKKTNK